MRLILAVLSVANVVLTAGSNLAGAGHGDLI